MHKKIIHANSHERKWGLILALPAISGFIVFFVFPIVFAFYMSMNEWKIGLAPKFIFLENFSKILKEPLFFKSFFATIYYTVLSTCCITVFSFIIADLLNEKIRFMKFFRVVFYVPMIIPAAVVGILWLFIYNYDFGYINTFLQMVGLPKSKLLMDEATAVPSLLFLKVWWSSGLPIIVFIAGFQGISKHYYELIDLESGKAWHKLRYVKIPFMSPAIFYIVVTQIIWTMQSIYEPLVMTKGGPNFATNFVNYYIYKEAFEFSNMGYASALSVIFFIIIMLFTFFLFRSSRFWVYSEKENR